MNLRELEKFEWKLLGVRLVSFAKKGHRSNSWRCLCLLASRKLCCQLRSRLLGTQLRARIASESRYQPWVNFSQARLDVRKHDLYYYLAREQGVDKRSGSITWSRRNGTNSVTITRRGFANSPIGQVVCLPKKWFGQFGLARHRGVGGEVKTQTTDEGYLFFVPKIKPTQKPFRRSKN